MTAPWAFEQPALVPLQKLLSRPRRGIANRPRLMQERKHVSVQGGIRISSAFALYLGNSRDQPVVQIHKSGGDGLLLRRPHAGSSRKIDPAGVREYTIGARTLLRMPHQEIGKSNHSTT